MSSTRVSSCNVGSEILSANVTSNSIHVSVFFGGSNYRPSDENMIITADMKTGILVMPLPHLKYPMREGDIARINIANQEKKAVYAAGVFDSDRVQIVYPDNQSFILSSYHEVFH
jgi:hypothetical protein